MKKFLAILVISLLWCNVGIADLEKGYFKAKCPKYLAGRDAEFELKITQGYDSDVSERQLIFKGIGVQKYFIKEKPNNIIGLQAYPVWDSKTGDHEYLYNFIYIPNTNYIKKGKFNIIIGKMVFNATGQDQKKNLGRCQ